MSFGFHFFDADAYTFHWKEFVAPVLSALFPIIGAVLLSKYKARIDKEALDYTSKLKLIEARLTQLHTKRVDVILEFHQAFLDTAVVLEHMQDEKNGIALIYKNYEEISKKLWKLLRDKKLYFPKTLADSMVALLDDLDKAAYSRAIEHEYPLTAKQIEIAGMIATLRGKLKLSQDALEEQFRSLLGVGL